MRHPKEIMEEYAKHRDWRFVYGRRDYQNLTNARDRVFNTAQDVKEQLLENEDKAILFIDPVVLTGTQNGLSRSTLTFMVLKYSDLHEEYKERFENYIFPLIQTIRSDVHSYFTCRNIDVQDIRISEVVNKLDINGDGIAVSLTIEYDYE